MFPLPTYVPGTFTDCGVPTSTAHGAVAYVEGTLVGATATYTCSAGYTLSGAGTSECQTDGTWSQHGVCVVGKMCAV